MIQPTGLLRRTSKVWPFAVEYSAQFVPSSGLSFYPTEMNATTFTLSTWFKIGSNQTGQMLFGARITSTNYFLVTHNSDGTFSIGDYISDTWNHTTRPTGVFVDSSAWYHLVVAYDTTQAVETERVRVYVNGQRRALQSSSQYPAYPSLNHEARWGNPACWHTIGLMGASINSAVYPFDGYMAEPCVVFGQALGPECFGEYSDKVPELWVPKKLYAVAWGVDDRRFPFSDAENLGRASVGEDVEVIGSPVQSTDTPTDNHATWNPLNPEDLGYSNGNKSVSSATSAIGCAYTTYGFPMEGDYALELRIDTGSAASVGVTNELKYNNAINQPEAVIYLPNGSIRTGGADTPYGETWATGDVIKAKVSGGALSFEKNGVDQGEAASGLTGTYWFLFQDSSTNYIAECTILSTTLTAANLPEPDVLDTSLFADIVLREGTGADVAIDNLKFPPDFVNIKDRDSAYSWYVFDSVRGATKAIYTDSTTAEVTQSEGLKEFLPTGYTLGTYIGTNQSGDSYVDLALKVGAVPGLEIYDVSHTNGTPTIINHTLGKPVTFAVTKHRDIDSSWWTYHTALGPDKYLHLSLTNAATSNVDIWPVNTSTQFALGAAFATGDYIVYLFTDSDVFKAFSFIGNGSTNGPFVDLGGRFLSIPFLKNSAYSTSAWLNWDTIRQPINLMGYTLRPDTTNVEVLHPYAQVLSTGFKPATGVDGYRTTINANGNLIVGLAILRQPMKYANAF